MIRTNERGNKMFEKIKDGLIVSCQALENEPLYGGDTMLKMAMAAKEGGAIGIRTNGPDNTQMIKEGTGLPVIGLVKRNYEGYEAYISPTPKEVDEIFGAGADMLAIDATDHTRPYPLDKLVAYAREKYPHGKLLADISTFEEAKRAEDLGFDAVAVTMVGYTPHTKGQKVPDFKLLEKLVQTMSIPVIAEGNFNTPEDAKRALEIGAHTVVVGSAITRPQLITKKFSEAVKNAKKD